MLISVSQLRIDSIDQSPLIFFQSKTPLLFPFPPPSLFARKWRIDSYFQESVQTPPTGWNRRRRRRIKKRGRHKILQIFITTVEFSPSQVARIRMGVLCIIELNLRLPSWFPPSLPSRLPLSLSLSLSLSLIHFIRYSSFFNSKCVIWIIIALLLHYELTNRTGNARQRRASAKNTHKLSHRMSHRMSHERHNFNRVAFSPFPNQTSNQIPTAIVN